ncbi:MAG: hypothetical protein K8L99_09660 [Anaerolineae bacterium]|nr:hypothetical protein [Anaerolineae bacterium]
MAESFNKLHNLVAAEVRMQRQLSKARKNISPAKMLGLFLEVCITNRGYSRRQFARILKLEQDLTDAVLDGFLPASELDDELLIDIAQAVKHHPNTLRIILGRDIVPSQTAETPPATKPPAELNGADTARSGS